MDSLYDQVIQVLLVEDEGKMQFIKGFRRKQEKNGRFHSLFTIFYPPAMQSFPKAQTESILPEYFHGPWGQAVAKVDETRASAKEETTAGSMEII